MLRNTLNLEGFQQISDRTNSSSSLFYLILCFTSHLSVTGPNDIDFLPLFMLGTHFILYFQAGKMYGLQAISFILFTQTIVQI